jgi:hypothetical protein
MKTEKYKIQYDLDAEPAIFPLTVFFTFTPGAPETRMQPADPDEIEVISVECDMLSALGETKIECAMNDSQEFYWWLLNNREKAEML